MGDEPRPLSSALLSLRDVTITFGGIHAVEALSFDLAPGEILSLIGPNGAGKTTVLNSISGFVRAQGSLRYRDIDLVRKPAYSRAGLGIGRTFQNLQLFGDMTLLENVIVGRHMSIGGNMLLDLLRFPVSGREREARRRSLEILELLQIGQYANRNVGGLPFGVQKLAGVARALAVEPDLLLLDEPAAGLIHREAGQFGDLILQLRQQLGVSILLVEHNMRLVMRISDRIVVLDGGAKLAEGSPTEIGANPDVVKAYLGEVEESGVVEEVQDELVERR